MGDTLSSQKQANFLERLQYFQTVQDNNHGKLDIFRMKQPPYEYILDHRKTFIQDQQRMTRYIQQAAKLKEIQHKNLARVHACILKQDKQLCIIHRVVHLYCNYYNFTLAQAIGKKKTTRNSFSEGDLIYLMSSMIETVNCLAKHGLAFGQFRTQSIYLSPEGHLKLYLLQLDPDYRHSSFHRVLAEPQKLTQHILSPQQLASIRKMQYQQKFNIQLSDIFAIGMVMLQLLTLDSARFYYNDQKMEVMLSKALFSLDIYQGKYSQELIDVIRGCLNADPKMRPDPEELAQKLQEMKGNGGRSNVYCIRLEAEENKEKKEEGPRPKGQYILNSLAKKLNPSPISTISSSSASLFRTSDPKSSSFRSSKPNSAFVKE